MFRGESNIVIDDKGRLAIPRDYRKVLIEHWGEPVRLTLTIGLTPDIERHRWLVAYPTPEWKAYEAKLNEVGPFDWEARKVAGMLIGHANDVKLDGQGRFVIPPSLRAFANLGTAGARTTDKGARAKGEDKIEAAIVGQGREFELWKKEERDKWREDSIASIGPILSNPSPGLLAISR